ncbi:hypothetical protein [Paraburkholderia caffeinilytica]|uniref:hypothetical protein n=1 Tax=Paraburkholderia caffeinilytica TaxID=1761016 RepID=UPI0038BD5D47
MERPRMHVLDWGRRMAAYAFDGPARPKCAPKKRPKHTSGLSGSGMTRHQLGEALRPGKISKPLAINCAAPARAPACAPARPLSPFD